MRFDKTDVGVGMSMHLDELPASHPADVAAAELAYSCDIAE
jgi:hypothetical protein